MAKSDRFELRMSPEQKAEWTEAARIAGMSLAAWIERQLVNAAFVSKQMVPRGGAGFPPPKPSKPSIPSEETGDELAALDEPVAPLVPRSSGLCIDCRRKGVPACPDCIKRNAKTFDTSKIFKRGE